MGVGKGRGQMGGAKGVMESALSNGALRRVGAVPGAKLWHLENVSTQESSFDTSACSGGETKKFWRTGKNTRGLM